MAIENTADREPLIHVAGMLGGTERYITEMESAGQSQLVNSDRLPTDRGDDAPFLELGFTFGDPEQGDPMFCPATLPDGWKREGSDHAMWSYLVDGLGRRRASIFYKAAFYDRRAFMRMETPSSYVQSKLWDGTPVLLDEEWLTPAVAVETLNRIAQMYDEQAIEADGLAAESPAERAGHWTDRASEHRVRRDAAWAMRDKLGLKS